MKLIWQDYLVFGVLILSLATTFMTRYVGIAKVQELGIGAELVKELEKNPAMRATMDTAFAFEFVSIIGVGISLGGYIIGRRAAIKMDTERGWMMFDLVMIMVSYVLINNFLHDLPSFLQWVVF